MVNPKSLQNLKPFLPGNQQARGKKQNGDVSLTAALKRYLRAHPDKIQSLVKSTVEQAHENPAFNREVFERIDGKVPQAIVGAGGGPVEILVRWDGNRNEPAPKTATEKP